MQGTNLLNCMLEYCVARTNKRYNSTTRKDPAGTSTRILRAAASNTAALLISLLSCCHVSVAAVDLKQKQPPSCE